VSASASERTHLLQNLASGAVSLRDLAGLNRRDVDSIKSLARGAFEGKRFGQAAALFRGLEALEGDEPLHTLNLAYAEAAAGQDGAAVEALTRFIDLDQPRDLVDVVRALVLRATLLAKSDPTAAALDLRAAHLLAERSDAAKAVLAGGGR